MSLFSSLSIAQSGLSTASTQLQVVASNVSNAGTEGYTKKSAVVTSASLGTVGGGVQVIGFSRATDTAVYTALTRATSNASLRATQDDYLQQVMDLYGMSESDNPALSSLMTEFVNSWTALAAEPESSVAQKEVVQAASNLAEEIQRLAGGVEELDRQCSKEIDATLDDLNGYLSQVQDLNRKIALAVTAGESAGDMEDARDQIVLKIAAITDVRVLARENGQIALYSSSGYQLVDGTSLRSFSYDGTYVTADNNTALPLNTALTGGSLEALVNFRDTSSAAASSLDPATGVLQKMRDQLDLIANSLLTTVTTATSGAATFASAYDNATTADGELAAGFFTSATANDARLTLSVNAALLNGTATIKVASASAVIESLLDSSRSFSSSGLSTAGASYASLTTASLTSFQQAANSVAALSDTAASAQNYLSVKLTNQTGVNTDEEMIQLITLQNVYAANARILSVVQDLFSILQSLIV